MIFGNEMEAWNSYYEHKGKKIFVHFIHERTVVLDVLFV